MLTFPTCSSRGDYPKRSDCLVDQLRDWVQPRALDLRPTQVTKCSLFAAHHSHPDRCAADKDVNPERWRWLAPILTLKRVGPSFLEPSEHCFGRGHSMKASQPW